jgi:dienelactone hydrolase
MNAIPVTAGLAVLDLARQGRFDEIRQMFAPQLQPMVTAEQLRVAWDAELARRGPIRSVGKALCEPAGPGMFLVRVPVACQLSALTLLVSVHESGSLVGIQLADAAAAQPTVAWGTPAYADPARFDEHDVTLGSDPLAVSGTLSLPRSAGPHPAVVLLGGSGVLDRDATIGRNKPFKDLAWGLASIGIAVLRFDKVTYAHPGEVNQLPDFTVIDEYRPATVAALHALRDQPAVDARRIFLLGHSLGGTVTPRIAATEPSLAGLVILAAGTEPLHWSAVRQVAYLASLNPRTAAAAQPVIDAMRQQATMVDSPELSTSTPASSLPFGVPAAYWLDLRTYDPATTAAALPMPILVLQGGRDYQVTVDGDLQRWRTGLAHHSNVTIRVYPADNHMFFPGTGPSTPAEYDEPQHLDPAVVTDIGNWIRTGSRATPIAPSPA